MSIAERRLFKLKAFYPAICSRSVTLLMGAPRSGRNSEAWSTRKKREQPKPLSEWLHENGYAKTVVNQVFAGTCPAGLLSTLKRARKGARGLDGNLSRSQRSTIHGQQDTPARDAKASGKGKGKAREGPPSAADPKALAAEKRALAAERKAAAAERRAEAAERKAAAKEAPQHTALGDDQPMDSAGEAWSCAYCGGAHRRTMPQCRLCSRARDGAAGGDACSPPARSPEAIAADRQRLQLLKTAMEADGLATEEIDKKLRALRREEEGPAPKLPHNQYEECRKAVARADALVSAMSDKRDSVGQRLDELMTDAACVDRALSKAREEQAEAAFALEKAAAALQPTCSAQGTPPALQTVLTSLQQIQDALQNGTVDKYIGDAPSLYQEYLNGGIPEGGHTDYDTWKTQHVASLIETEVLNSCRALRRMAPPTASTPARADDYTPTQLGTQEPNASVADAEVAVLVKGMGKGSKGKPSERYEPHGSSEPPGPP